MRALSYKTVRVSTSNDAALSKPLWQLTLYPAFGKLYYKLPGYVQGGLARVSRGGGGHSVVYRLLRF